MVVKWGVYDGKKCAVSRKNAAFWLKNEHLRLAKNFFGISHLVRRCGGRTGAIFGPIWPRRRGVLALGRCANRRKRAMGGFCMRRAGWKPRRTTAGDKR
jgi:hypothetical protein